MCHEDLVQNKPVHAAIKKGCQFCHSAIDASDVPHKKTNKSSKGLTSEQPELCYGCHAKAKFMKKTIHLAIGMGCSECHNPHSSKQPKLLVAAMPDPCFKCHHKEEFIKKNIHPPVAQGKCMLCHDPHTSDNGSLLRKEPGKLCLDCHSSVEKKPHTAANHSLGNPEKQDPKRPKKKFTCGSCHNPHASDSIKLLRYPAESEMDICITCHDF